MQVVLDRGLRAKPSLWALPFLLAFSWSSPALAAPAPGSIELTWNAPVGCPDREQVLESIRELMGGEAPATEVSVRADLARTDARLVMELVLKTPGMSAQRTMEATDCAELARGAALIVALAAGPPHEEAGPEARKREPVAAPTKTSSGSAESPSGFTDAVDGTAASVPAEASRRSVRWAPRALFAFDVGSLPNPTIGGALGTNLDLGAFAAAAEALVLVPQRVTTPVGGGRLWSVALALRPCLRIPMVRSYLAPCAVLDVEMMASRGENVTFKEDGVVWFLRFGAGAEFGYALNRRVSLVTGAWLLAAPQRPTFVVDGTVEVHRPALFAGRIATGLSFFL